MNTVTVYQASIHDLDKNADHLSRRWWSREGFDRMQVIGKLLEDTATEVDASVLDGDGVTAIDFNPFDASQNGSDMLAHAARCLST